MIGRGFVMRRFFLDAFRDFLDAFRRVMPTVTWLGAATFGLGVIAGAWVYVPVHELLHVAGCVATGGTVHRLEISPEYGAALLAKIFPFVAVGSEYSGQLVGFDTGGNDLVYLSTVLAPYLLTVFVGAPLLRTLGHRGSDGAGGRFLLGAMIPVAFAPFSNLLGDYYELGSIPVSRLVAALAAGTDPARWRSDDLIKLAKQLFGGDWQAHDPIAMASGFLLGAFCAFATYWLGGALHRRVRPAARRG
jgi:hypothetical protein